MGRAGEQALERFVGEESGGAVEIVEGEFHGGRCGAAGGGFQVIGSEDEFSVIAALDGDGGGNVEGHLADEGAGVIGDAAHDIEASGGAADEDIFAVCFKDAVRVALDAFEQFGNGRGQEDGSGHGGYSRYTKDRIG